MVEVVVVIWPGKAQPQMFGATNVEVVVEKEWVVTMGEEGQMEKVEEEMSLWMEWMMKWM